MFIALALALLVEQWWPLRAGNPLHAGYLGFTDYIARTFAEGNEHASPVAWALAVLPAGIAAALVYTLLKHTGALFGLLWSAAVLYVTIGFRQFSHHFSEIAKAINLQDIATARDVLARWRGAPSDELSSAEVARLSIELGLLQAHRHVLGPVFWFVLLGPFGAVVYRATDMVAVHWHRNTNPGLRALAQWADRALHVIDWLPARATAAAFAIAGNFEDAAFCWRTQATVWSKGNDGVVLAAGAGALGVRLGGAVREDGMIHERPDIGTGEAAGVDDLRAAVGLIWRALALWLVLLLVVGLSRAVG